MEILLDDLRRVGKSLPTSSRKGYLQESRNEINLEARTRAQELSLCEPGSDSDRNVKTSWRLAETPYSFR